MVRSLTADHEPETIRHHVGLFRRIGGEARGQYQLPPIELHHRPGVTVGADAPVSMALLQLVLRSRLQRKGWDHGRDGRGRDRNSDEERAAATAS